MMMLLCRQELTKVDVLLTFDAISLLFAKYRVKDLQNMDRISLQRTLDAEAERDPMEQRR